MIITYIRTRLLEFIQHNNRLFLLIVILVFLMAAYSGLQNVGYYYDELLHAVASQETIKGLGYQAEVHRVIKFSVGEHTIPLMILYYVGPLKSFALIPPFLIFSSSLLILRSFTIFCGVITLVATHYLVRHHISQKTAIITTILLSTDPTFILASRYDWGPIALQNVFKILILIAFFRIRSHQTVKISLFLLGAISALMLWDKLNAVWFLMPISIILINTLRHNILLLRYTILGFLICVSPLLVIISKRPFFYTESQKSFVHFEEYYYQNKTNSNLEALLSHYQSSPSIKLKNIIDTLNGVSIPNQILSAPVKSTTVFTYVFVFIALIICLKNLSSFRILLQKKSITNSYIIIFLLATTIILSLLITPHANAPHHVLLVYPLLHIVLAGMLIALYSKQRILISLIILLLVFSNFTVLFEFNNKTKSNLMRAFWKRNNLQLVVEKLQGDRGKYIALDWGITLPIGYLSNGSIPIRDLQAFYEPKCQELQKYIDLGYSAILYTRNNQVFPTYYTHCQEELSQLIPEDISDYILYKNNSIIN